MALGGTWLVLGGASLKGFVGFRGQARRRALCDVKDYVTADALKFELKALGVTVVHRAELN